MKKPQKVKTSVLVLRLISIWFFASTAWYFSKAQYGEFATALFLAMGFLAFSFRQQNKPPKPSNAEVFLKALQEDREARDKEKNK